MTLVGAACGPVNPSPVVTSPAATRGATASEGPVPSDTAAATGPLSTSSFGPPPECLLTTQPGPGDQPPSGSGDLLDLSDFGGGRYRLCLTDPVTGTYEHTAWCAWTPDRTAVREVDGVPMRLGEIAYDAAVLLGPEAFQLSLTDPAGLVSTYDASADHLTSEVGQDGRSGYVAFEVSLSLDPESSAPADAAPLYRGAMSWLCGEPPPA